MVIAADWYILKPILKYVFGEFCTIFFLFLSLPLPHITPPPPPPPLSPSLSISLSLSHTHTHTHTQFLFMKRIIYPLRFAFKQSQFYPCLKEIKKVSAIIANSYALLNTPFKLKFPNNILKIKQHKQ